MFFLCSVLICCFFSTVSTQGASTGVVRLYRNGVADTSQSWSSGIVQIYYSYQWGNICDDYYFGSDEADVICHQLGYSGASTYSNTGYTTTWGSDSSPTVMDDVSCSTSSYLAITQCSFSTYISSYSCTSSDDVIVSCYSTRIWASPSAGDIRLTGGTYSNQGLLEVYCNGQWGTVCDDNFHSTQARVACRQLGYNYYTDYDHLSQRGNYSQKIFLDSLSGCGSSDDCLTECGGCPSSGITSCEHYEDITLECKYSSSYSKVATERYDYCSYSIDDTTSSGIVRLYRNGVPDTSQSWSSGIVQIYYSSQWGNICDDYYFGYDEADVICHQLGYSGASSYSNTGDTTTWGYDYSPTVMDDVSCSSSSYLTITQCFFDTGSLISSSCTNSDDVTVSCYSTRIWASPSAGDIRLTGGTYSNQGLLEVYCNGQWGTVCDDDFYSTQARVACRQLGYNYYEDYDHLSQRGTSSQEIFLDSLSGCGSYDDCLTECGGCPSSGIDSCEHYEDITLECRYYSSYSKVYTKRYDFCSYYDDSISTGVLVAAIVGSIVGFIVCIIIIIAVPICICVCLGVGIGAASRSGTRGVAYQRAPSATTTAVVLTQDTANTTAAAGYPTQPGAQELAYFPADPDKPAEHQPPPPPTAAGYGPPPEYSSPYQPTPANIPQQEPPGQEQIGYTDGYPAQ